MNIPLSQNEYRVCPKLGITLDNFRYRYTGVAAINALYTNSHDALRETAAALTFIKNYDIIIIYKL